MDELLQEIKNQRFKMGLLIIRSIDLDMQANECHSQFEMIKQEMTHQQTTDNNIAKFRQLEKILAESKRLCEESKLIAAQMVTIKNNIKKLEDRVRVRVNIMKCCPATQDLLKELEDL